MEGPKWEYMDLKLSPGVYFDESDRGGFWNPIRQAWEDTEAKYSPDGWELDFPYLDPHEAWNAFIEMVENGRAKVRTEGIVRKRLVLDQCSIRVRR